MSDDDEAPEPRRSRRDGSTRRSKRAARPARMRAERNATDEVTRAIQGTAESEAQAAARARSTAARASRERRIRALLTLAAASAVAGIALSGSRTSVLGEVLIVGGMLGLIAGIHVFGRLGHDARL